MIRLFTNTMDRRVKAGDDGEVINRIPDDPATHCSNTLGIMTFLRLPNLVFAVWATLTPLAHVLELPNKLALDGSLWLAVQQHLYRGWGPLLGAPAEIGALITSLGLLFARRARARERWLTTVAVAAYAAMLATFFVLNAPVNDAVNGWTSASLPNDWPAYRMRWEIGHALAALMAVIGLAAVLRAWFAETSIPERVQGQNPLIL